MCVLHYFLMAVYYSVVGITIICLICLLFVNIEIVSLSHISLALKATLFDCPVTQLPSTRDLTILGGSLWLTYYCDYRNDSTTDF